PLQILLQEFPTPSSSQQAEDAWQKCSQEQEKIQTHLRHLSQKSQQLQQEVALMHQPSVDTSLVGCPLCKQPLNNNTLHDLTHAAERKQRRYEHQKKRLLSYAMILQHRMP